MNFVGLYLMVAAANYVTIHVATENIDAIYNSECKKICSMLIVYLIAGTLYCKVILVLAFRKSGDLLPR